MRKEIADSLTKLPTAPGVYRMKNVKGTIIYVGKSVNLKSRVRSYFADGAALNAAKTKMVGEIRSIDWIETRSESEALILETNLIKELSPKYNVLMKDDKNLAYVRIDPGLISDVMKTREKRKDASRYYGPFPSGARVVATLKTLKRLFKIRSCAMKFGQQAGKPIILSKAGMTPPCMDFYIGICPAPCLLTDVSVAKHRENVESLEAFLRGDRTEVLASLETKMREFAKNLEFEEAKKIKDQLDAISMLSEKQIARNMIEGDVDAFFLLPRHNRIFAGFASIRSGELRAITRFEVENPLELEQSELLEEILSRKYSPEETEGNLPKTLLLAKELENTLSEPLTEFLGNTKIRLEFPSIGPKADLLVFLKTNILNFAHQNEMEELSKKTLSRATMKSILEAIGYTAPKKWPVTFECYDISHTDGHFTVASRVVLEDGKPKNSAYKKYKIKTLADGMIDDFASMREVLERRAREWLELGNFPTMMLIDGGKWQLSAAKEAMEKVLAEVKNEITGTSGVLSRRHREALGSEEETPEMPINASYTEEVSKELPPLPFLASLAKREEEIFVPGKSESHLFEKGSPELSALQTIRDEAHRFAIGFNRAKRTKEMKKNILEELPGFGPATRKKLLKLAGSTAGIPELSEAELLTVLSKPQLETLKDHGLFQ